MTTRTAQRAVIEQFVARIPEHVESHRSAQGGYARMRSERERDDAYGLADAVGILWSVDALGDAAARDDLARRLRALRRPDGVFPEPTHGAIHSTAMCTGSLALLGAELTPDVPFLAPVWEPANVAGFLASRDWDEPWLSSHDVAGLAAIATVTGVATRAWLDAYFGWLDANVDPATGLWPAGGIQAKEEWPGLFGNLGCSFHMHFIYTWHHRLLPRGRQLVDACLDIYDDTPWVREGEEVAWRELDWIYSLRLASAQTGHRVRDVQERVDRLLERVVGVLDDGGFADSSHLTDLHTLSALTATVAELTRAVPDVAPEGHPLRAVLDVRPFI
jgi:hypothetical protein